MDISLREELVGLLNKHSAENGSDTPDFILADYLMNCLDAFDKAVTAREKWYGRAPVTVDPPATSPWMCDQCHHPVPTQDSPCPVHGAPGPAGWCPF